METKYEDAIMKRAWATFARDGLKLFGIDKKVKELGPTEIVTIEIRNKFMDYNYLMEDDTYSHFEFQTTNNNTSDLRRFRAYEAVLSLETGKPVVTYVIYSGSIKNPNCVLKEGVNDYRVIPISLANLDGDALVEKVKKKIEAGESLSHEDAVSIGFNAVMGGNRSQKEKILDTIRLAKHFKGNTKMELESISYAFAMKFLKGQDLEKIKEEIRMSELGRMLVEEGKVEGIIEGENKATLSIAQKAILNGLDDSMIQSLTDLPLQEISLLRKITPKNDK